MVNKLLRSASKLLPVLTFLGISAIAAVVLPQSTYAATFSIGGPSEVVVGEPFLVTVAVTSVGTAVNAVSGTIAFSPSMFEVVNISKANSIINLWVAEPTFSNTNGTVAFEGVSLNPGFMGSNKNIITLTLRAKSAGLAQLRFIEGAILANDGMGSDIAVGAANVRFSTTAEAPPMVKPAIKLPTATPQKPPETKTATATPATQPSVEVKNEAPTIAIPATLAPTSNEKHPLRLLLVVAGIAFLCGALFAGLVFKSIMASRSARVFHPSLGHNTKNTLEKAFTILRNDVHQHAVKLRKAEGKRKLSTEEIHFLHQFEKELTEAQSAIEDNIP